MSIKSWKKEFYNENNDNRILTKWIGCRKENLEKHNLYAKGRVLRNQHTPFDRFSLDSTNCSWCEIANKEFDARFKGFSLSSSIHCHYCPAVISGTGCCDSPWKKWIIRYDPEPMIKWVRQALKKIKEQKRDVK